MEFWLPMVIDEKHRITVCQADATFLVAGGLRTIVTTDAHYIQLQGCGQTLMTKQLML